MNAPYTGPMTYKTEAGLVTLPCTASQTDKTESLQIEVG